MISGSCIVFLTILMSLLAFKHYDWAVLTSAHSVMGFIVLLSVGLIAIGGFITWSLMAATKPNLTQLKVTKNFHKYTGYALIATSEITILLGVMNYSDYYDETP